jgi:acyl-CoA synthetase (AMP-forming)/AMP-acid ligase II
MKASSHVGLMGRGAVILEDGSEHSAADILATAERLSRFERSILVWSDRAVDVASVVQAAALGTIGVYVAHPDMSRNLVNELAAFHEIGAVLTSGRLEEIHPVSAAARSTKPGEIVVMTSGTTGTPKLARHTIDSLTGTIRAPARASGSRWLLTYPPSSFAGLQVLLTALVGGGSLVVSAERSPDGFIASAAQNGVTHISGTPTFWRSFLMAHTEGTVDLASITIGGEAVDQATLDRVSESFPEATIRHIYASTELGVLFSVTDGQAGFPASWLDVAPGNIELRIREDVLEARTTRMMHGYASEHRESVDADGWYHTGDLVELVSGRAQFRGRADRMINVGGYKVRPEEIEPLILARSDVVDARVYGRQSSLTGEIVAAEVVGRDIGNEVAFKRSLVADLRSQLESYKVPRLVEVVTSIEVSDSGKKAR